MWTFILLAFMSAKVSAQDFEVHRSITWDTEYGLVFVKGKIRNPVDFRSPTFSGFFGDQESWNLGTFGRRGERCEFRSPMVRSGARWQKFTGKQVEIAQGARIELVNLRDYDVTSNIFREDSDKSFDSSGVFSVDLYHHTPRTDIVPEQLLIKIRCRGDKSQALAMKKHLKSFGSVLP